MTWRKYILFPFGLIFGTMVQLRRSLYNFGLFRSESPEIPTIVVGNITVGGTGKTPFVIWLAHKLYMKKPSVLSRGYGRKTGGFLKVEHGMPVEAVGDEPMEMRNLLPSNIANFVCENRVAGIEQVKKTTPETELIILDDGLQHLQLKARVSLLLCNYHKPFFKDWPMPAGNLREFAINARFANVIVVSKCPADMKMAEAVQWRERLARYGVPVFFAAYNNNIAKSNSIELPYGSKVVLVSALAGNENFEKWAEKHYRVGAKYRYPDHFYFKPIHLNQWKKSVQSTEAAGILCTGKDVSKIAELEPECPVFVSNYEPEILFDGEDALIELLLTKIN